VQAAVSGVIFLRSYVLVVQGDRFSARWFLGGGDPVRFNIDTLLNASHMKNLIELETEIKHLPEHEIRQLTERLQVYLEEKWDRQMETDLASGRLDRLIAKAEADIAANHVKDLDEVLHNP
jgi:hypothetical protein